MDQGLSPRRLTLTSGKNGNQWHREKQEASGMKAGEDQSDGAIYEQDGQQLQKDDSRNLGIL